MQLPFPVYVINLPRAKQRRADILSRLQTANVKFEFVDAVDGENLDMNSINHRLQNHNLTAGEIGCFLSHYSLYQRIADEKIPFALILEDDTAWDNDFFATALQVVNSKYYWNIAHLSSPRINKVIRIIDNFGKRQLMQLKNVPGNTDAYLIDLDGAKKMLRHCYLICDNIDQHWKLEWQSKCYFYSVIPPPARQNNSPSDIDHSQTNKKPKQKRIEQLGRWSYFWRANKKRYTRKLFHLTHPRKLRKS